MDAELIDDLVRDDSDDDFDDDSDEDDQRDDSSGEESDSEDEETIKLTYETNKRYLQTQHDKGEKVDGNGVCDQVNFFS